MLRTESVSVIKCEYMLPDRDTRQTSHKTPHTCYTDILGHVMHIHTETESDTAPQARRKKKSSAAREPLAAPTFDGARVAYRPPLAPAALRSPSASIER